MADIELVIDIPEETYIYLRNGGTIGASLMIENAIKNGTPLPKGHGDLIDVDRKITVPVYDEQYEEWEEKILTVREALNRWSDEGITIKDVIVLTDKAESEDKDGVFIQTNKSISR